MKSVRLIVDPGALRQDGTRPATGRIWLEVGGTPFPAHRWNELVVVVAGAWVEAVHAMTSGQDQAIVHFMDGPFSVELSVAANGLWRARLGAPGGRSMTPRTACFRPSPLAVSVADAARDVLREYSARRLRWDRDAQALETGLVALERALSALER